MARTPSVGEILDGYRFLGGDPADEKAWEAFDGAPRIGDILDGYRFVGGDPASEEAWKKPGLVTSARVAVARMGADAPPAPETVPAPETAAHVPAIDDPQQAARAGAEYWTGGLEPPKAPTAASEPPTIASGLDAELGRGDYASPSGDREGQALKAIGARLGQAAAELPAHLANLVERLPDLNPLDAGALMRRGLGVRHKTILSDAAHYFEEKAKWWEDKVPEAYRAAEKKIWINDDLTLGDAWSDPKSYLMGVTGSIPATLVTMIPGLSAAQAIYARLVPKLGVEAAATRAAAVAGIAGRLSEGALEGSANDLEAREQIGKMTREQLEQSDAFRAMVQSGMPAAAAREALANDVGLRTLVLSGVATGIFSGAGDKLMARAITRGLDGNVVSRAFRGAVAEGILEEAPQGFFGAVGKNVAMRAATPDTPLLQGAFNEAAAGAVAGGIMGGAMAAPFRSPTERVPTASEIDITKMPSAEAIRAIANAPVTPIEDAGAGPVAPAPGAPPPGGPGIIAGAMGLDDMGLSAPMGGSDAGTVEGAGAQPLTPITTPAGPPSAPGAPGAAVDGGAAGPAGAPAGMGPGAPPEAGGSAAPATEDFHTRRGELKVFGSQDDALRYADSKTNRVPGNFRPRQADDGTWVLSRPIRERTEAQRANDARLRRKRSQIDPATDNLGRMIAKMGGIRAEDLETDGADPADLRSWRSGIVGRPIVRRNGGMSLDALTELLAGHGFDLLDEAGRPDASKLRDLIDEELAGNPIFTPEGYEALAGKEQEWRQEQAAAAALDIPDEELQAAGYNDLPEDDQDAISDAIEAGADAELDAIEDAEAEKLDALWDEGGRPATDEDIDAIFGPGPAKAGGLPQADTAGAAGQGPAGASPAPQDAPGAQAVAGADDFDGAPPAGANATPAQTTPASAGVAISGGRWDFETTFPRPLAEEIGDMDESMFAGLEGEDLENGIREWHGDVGAEIGAAIARRRALEEHRREGLDPKTGKPPKDPEEWRKRMEREIAGLDEKVAGSLDEYETEFGTEARDEFERALRAFYEREAADEDGSGPPGEPTDGAAKPAPKPKKLTKKQLEKEAKAEAERKAEEARWEKWKAEKLKENQATVAKVKEGALALAEHLDEAPEELRPLYRLLYAAAHEIEAGEFDGQQDTPEVAYREDSDEGDVEDGRAEREAITAAREWAWEAWLAGDDRVTFDTGGATIFVINTPAGQLQLIEWGSLDQGRASLNVLERDPERFRRDQVVAVPFASTVELFGYGWDDGKKVKIPTGVLHGEVWNAPSADEHKTDGKPVTIKSARTIDGELYAINHANLSGAHILTATKLTPAAEWGGKTYPTKSAVRDSWKENEGRRGHYDGLEVTYRGQKYVLGGDARLLIPERPVGSVTVETAKEELEKFLGRLGAVWRENLDPTPAPFGDSWAWHWRERGGSGLVAVKLGGKVYIERVDDSTMNLWERGLPGPAPAGGAAPEKAPAKTKPAPAPAPTDRETRTRDAQEANKAQWLNEVLPEVEAELPTLPEALRVLIERAVNERREAASAPPGIYSTALGGRLVMGTHSRNETITREEFDQAVEAARALDAKPNEDGFGKRWELTTTAGEIHIYEEPALGSREEKFGVWVETPAEIRRLGGAPFGRPALDLTGETEAEIRSREERERREREAKTRRDAAPDAGDFVLTGSNRPVDQARARGQMELAPTEPAEEAPEAPAGSFAMPEGDAQRIPDDHQLATTETYKSKSAAFEIGVVQIGTNEWITRAKGEHRQGDFSGFIYGFSPLHGAVDATRERALDRRAREIIAGQRSIIDSGASGVTPSQRAEARKVIAWASGFLISRSPDAQLVVDAEPAAFELQRKARGPWVTNSLGTPMPGQQPPAEFTAAVARREESGANASPYHFALGWASGEAGLTPERVTDDVLAEVPEEARPDFVAGVNAYVARDVQAVESQQEADDVPGGSADSQPDSADRPDADLVGQGALFDDAGGPDGGARRAGRGARSGGGGRPGGAGVPGGRPAAGGAPGDQPVHRDDGEFGAPGQPAGSDDGGGGGDAGDAGVRPDPGRGERAGRPSVSDAADLARRRDEQARAENLPIVPNDPDNIRATLPMLTEGQQGDVAFAEARFAKENGFGVMFTNGTGTGKTYTGLGIVKRAHRQGKKNILIIAPSDKVIADWTARGENLLLDIKALPDTASNNGGGLAITTYANLATNPSLAGVEWDMVLADEAHHLLANKDGEATAALAAFRAITKHPDGRWSRARMILREENEALEEASRRLRQAERDRRTGSTTTQQVQDAEAAVRRASDAFEAKARPIYEDVMRAGQARTRVAFLSATPFAYVPNVDYAEGYLFSFDDWGRAPQPETGYNAPGHRDSFYIQHFGYKMRYGRLEQPDPEVDRGLMERNFNGWLKREGVLSGRMLEVDQDYDRRFVSSDHPIGQKIDEGLEWLREHDEFRVLYDIAIARFGYLERRFLLEAIKARDIVPMVKEHLALGRKVVIVHDYKVGGASNPFHFEKDGSTQYVYSAATGRHEVVELDPIIERFQAARPDLAKLAVSRMPPALSTLTAAFPDALVFNGDIPKRERRRAVEEFQKDGNGKNVIIVQSSAGREGVSLHDETGKHPRVLFNLGLPVQPTAAIQLEGRIFRLGQMSNAAFRYLNTGTTWERWAFAGTIAQRAGTAENLALGDDARALRQAFIDAFEATDPHAASDTDGTGGKERDRASASLMTPFERAKTFYFAQQRRTSRNRSREGIDYFATPEPLAYKMVEWADIRPGDSLLEPSAGHGAIARFFPEMHRAKMVEPSMELGSRAKLAAPHVEAVSSRFEDLDIHNKADVIVMNPPFGTGGKTAMEHLAKAFGHLRDGGRIVAIIPEGPAMEKRFDAWLYGEDAKGRSTNPHAFLVASIKLPRATFERAGTEVAARVVIIEKHFNAEKARGIQQVNRDYSGADTIREFFGRIEDAGVPARANPQPEDGDDFAGAPAAAQNTPRYARSPASPYQKDLFGNDLPIATGGGAPLFGQDEAPGRPGDVGSSPALPDAWFGQKVQPVTVGKVAIGVERVRSAADAAHVFAALRKDYRERFAVLVLDGGDRPIAYLPLFAGERTMTSVYPAIIAAEVYTTPDARKIWIAHNHPSGVPEPSFADISLTRVIAGRFGDDLGVQLAGHVIIAGNRFAELDRAGDRVGTSADIPAKGRRRTVPITERRAFARNGTQARVAITSPTAAKDAVPQALNFHSGVVYVDGQKRIIAAVPGRIEDAESLRRDGRFRRAIAPGAESGAIGAFYYISKEDAAGDRGRRAEKATLNLATALLEVLEVESLDILSQDEAWPRRPSSFAERGMDRTSHAFFARGFLSPVVASLEAIADTPGAFRYPESTATAWPDVIRDMAGARGWSAAPGDGLGDELATGGSRLYLYRGGDRMEDGLLMGSSAFLEINRADTITPYATIGGKLDTEGALAYQVAMTWAHNNGKRLVPDPSGLTAKNRLRRSEAMISSMLRHKTSVHLEPHASQFIGLLGQEDFERARDFMSPVEPGTAAGRKLERLKEALWKDEALAETPEEARRIYESNLHNLALASSLLTHRLYPDAYLLDVTPDGEIRDTITDEPVSEMGSAESARVGVGRTTLARAVAVRSALQGVDTYDVAALRLNRDGFLQPGGVEILAERRQGGALSPAGAGRLVAEQGRVLYGRGAQDKDAVPIADIAAGTAKPLRREGLSVSGVYRLLYAGMGQDGVDALVDAGHLRVVARIADLPERLRRVIAESGNPAVDAVYDGERTAYIIAANIDPDRVVPVVFHEIGEHFGLERLLGPEDYRKVLDKVRALHANGDRVVTEAWRYVLQHYRDDAGELELAEGGDDFVKEVIARVGEGAPAMSQDWWRELLQMVRNALRRMGFTVRFTADDLTTLVRASLARVVRDARQARYVPSAADERVRSVAFSTTTATAGRSQVDTPAFRAWFKDSKVVDKDGKPLVVYRGLPEEPTSAAGPEWWTDSANAAGQYAEGLVGGSFDGSTDQPNIVPAFLSIKKPYTLKTDEQYRRLSRWLGESPEALGSGEISLYTDIDRVVEVLVAKGYDGLVLDDVTEDRAHTTWVTFSPSQAKSSVGNRGTFDPQNADIRFSRGAEPAPVWFSALARAVEGAKQEVAPAAQWKAWLKNQPGVKADEIEWSGVNEWLDTQGPKVTKAALLDYLRNNGVKVEETLLGDAPEIEIHSTDWNEDEPDAEFMDEQARDFHLDSAKNEIAGEEGVDPSEVDEAEAMERAREYAMNEYYNDPDRPSTKTFTVMAGDRELEYVADMSYGEIDLWRKGGDGASLYQGKARGMDDPQMERLIREDALKVWGIPDPEEAQTQFESYTLPGGDDYRELLLTLPTTELPGQKVRREARNAARLPGRAAIFREYEARINELHRKIMDIGLSNEERALANAERIRLEDERDGRAIEAAGDIEEPKAPKFHSAHFTPANILAHVRFKERADADGRSILFIEEIQSDWAQVGKRRGFKTGAAFMNFSDWLEATHPELQPRMLSIWNDHRSEPEVWAEWEVARDNAINEGSRPPVAPFVTKTEAWVGLALKRMVRYAADNGFDGIAWTTGDQQADRYDLSKHVDRIEARRVADGAYLVKAFDKVRGRAVIDGEYKADELPDVIGKEATEKVIEAAERAAGRPPITELPEGFVVSMDHHSFPATIAGDQAIAAQPFTIIPPGQDHGRPYAGWHETEEAAIAAAVARLNAAQDKVGVVHGLDLKIGGEGMAAFYDRIVPNVVNDLLKKMGGGRVSELSIPITGAVPRQGRPANEAIADLLREDEGAKQPGFYLTPAMKEKAAEGMPMFARHKPTGDPVLDEARRKAGLVRDARNLAERASDYLGRGWAAIRQDLADFRHALAQGAVDRFHAIKLLEQTIGGVPAEQSAYVAARLSTGTSSVMRGMLIYGAPELRDGIIQRKEGSKGLLDVLAPVREDFDDWIGWMVGVRATRLMQEKRERNLTEEEIEALVKLGEGKTDRFIAAAREFAAYKRTVLDLAEAAGLINPETRPVWDQADWIPFYRVKDGAAAVGPRNRRGLAGQTSGIRTLKGGEQAINDPLENILLNFTHLVDASMKNVAMQRAAELAGAAGILEHAPYEWEREIVAASDIKKRLREHGVSEEIIDFMPPDVFKGLAAMWAVKPPSDKDVVRVMVGGKPVFYRVLDQLLLRALTAVDAPDLAWTAPMRAFKRVLTRAVTATPDFMARNFIRDALSAWAISEDHFRVGIDSVRGAVKSLREQGGMLDMMFAGGSFMGGYVNGNDPTATAEATRKALRERGWSAASVDEFMATIIDTPVRWWEKWEELGSAIENANREAVYEAATREGKSKAQAAFEAKDLMDYSMRGDWIAFQVLGDVVPFFNARLQGLYKLGRAAADHPGRMALRGGVIMLATLALLAANDGDDRYEELEEWDRDTYWHFWIGGQHIRIPKPFEIGVIFATIPERMARMIAQRDDPALTMKRLWWNLSESLNLVQWPQIVAPAAEVWANRSTFTGRPIESKADEAKLPEARASATTSDTMKAIARLAPDAVNATGMSPKRLEHLWRGYLGELGGYALGLSDIAVRAVTGAPPRPALRADDVPLVKSFVREDPARATRWKTELYDMDREVDEIYRSVMAYRRDGDGARAKALIEKEGRKLAARPGLSAATDRLADIRRERERVFRDPDMTREDKRLRLDELQAVENELAQRAARSLRRAFVD